MTTALDKDINTLPDHDILDMEKEMREELEKALCYSADKFTCTAVFVPGKLDIQAMQNMIGETHSFSMEEKYNLDKFSSRISCVKPISDTNAWVGEDRNMYAKLIDLAGEESKSMKTSCKDLVISRSGDFVLINKGKRNISVLNKDEKTISTIDTKPLYPAWISKTENDDLLVTLKDDGDIHPLLPTSRRIVQRMTLAMKVLQTYEFREDGKTRLFTFPGRTAENKNTDICVVNVLSENTGELVVLHRDGRLKFTYRGHRLMFDQFYPHAVECDSKCHILFTDRYSGSIHILSAEGMYLCTLCQYEQLNPWVISINGGDLWCGFKEGRLKVLKYKN